MEEDILFLTLSHIRHYDKNKYSYDNAGSAILDSYYSFSNQREKMKEFNKTIGLESLSKGLRRDFRSPRNTLELITCFNCKPSEWGIVPYDHVRIPFTQDVLAEWGISLNWPYPQIFKGMSKTIIADIDKFFFVNEDDWSIQTIDLYDVYAPADVKTIQSSGRPWSFIDCYDSWFMTNGINTVFHANHRTMQAASFSNGIPINDKVLVDDRVPFEAGSYYKGRIVLGGFNPEVFWNSTWIEDWEDVDNAAGTGISTILKGLDENFILWSSVGGGGIPLFLYLPSYAKSSFITAEGYGGTGRNMWLDLMRREDWGFRPMPWKGKIRATKILGEMLVVYGASGITVLKHTSEPISTLAEIRVAEIEKIGIPGPGAVGGDAFSHVFVDNSGAVWRMDASLKPQRLGYKEYIQPMLENEIVISHSQDEDEFWICNNNETFHLNKLGLSETDQVVTSVIDSQGIRYGLGQDAQDITRSSIVTWDSIDFGNRGRKTLEQVQLPTDIGSFESADFSVFWRNKASEGFKQSPWKRINSDGVAWPKISAVEFRPSIRFNVLEKANVNYITLSYKQSDKRYIRGAYAAETDQ